MTIKQFIEKAIAGGWKTDWYDDWEGGSYSDMVIPRILLDPLAWQAVGKTEGWIGYKRTGIDKGNEIEYHDMEVWKSNMHRMIDALAEGKTIEQFLEPL